ncbi:MAG: LacI family transcriptional regulator [Bauldia litoralis]
MDAGPKNGRATIRSIAEDTGLSIATVSRALQDSPSVRPETIEIVLAAAERLGYRRNPAGAGLRSGRTETICLVMPIAREGDMLGDVGALRLATGANHRLAGTGYNLSLVPFAPGDDPFEAMIGVVRRGNFDGIILSSTRPDDARVRYLHRRNIPFVTFGRTELPFAHAHYDVDNEHFVRRAVRLLVERGCRKPVLFAPPRELMFSQHRIAGFRQALAEAGLACDDTAIVDEANQVALVDEGMRLAAADQRPDSYICGGEIGALAVMRALERAGQAVGRDVHLVTMETSALPALFSPPLTAFFQDLHHAGAVLADFILRRVDGAPPEDLQRVDTMTLRERA